jgi:hypothetical protein
MNHAELLCHLSRWGERILSGRAPAALVQVGDSHPRILSGLRPK